ncbi:MAG: hypothetical protein P8Q23_11980 [Paracoccaceae bacterium]|nr:hypothetical protein [Paracoccaceae bacterium]
MQDGKQKIFVHVGHGKTGTTATQHLLALNESRLSRMGVCYPKTHMTRAAAEGKVTSGNIDWRGAGTRWLDKQILPAVQRHPGHATYVFSNEILFWDVPTKLAEMTALSDSFDFRIVLSVREPFEMLTSHYSQAIKRGGFFGDISEIAEKENHLIWAVEVIKACQASGVGLHMSNYSFHHDRISRRILELVGVTTAEFGQLLPAKQNVLNRSLTRAEQGALKTINRKLGPRFGIACSDALVESLPDISAENALIDADTEQRMIELNREAVAFVNMHLPEGQKLTLESTSTRREDAATLSPQQLDVLLLSIAQEMKNTRRLPAGKRLRKGMQKLFSHWQG